MLTAECVQVSVILISDPGASRELALRHLGPEKLLLYRDKFDFVGF